MKISRKCQNEEKAEKCNLFLEVCLVELDQGKTINRVPDRILHSCLKPFCNDIVSQSNCARQFKLTGIGIEIWYRYH